MDKEVRVRFAPSPTGYLHIGGARTALFNWLFARSQGGKLVLRIEDTDQDRLKEDSVSQIITSLKWLGLSWDEGPEVGGPVGPYFQSERFDIYRKYCQQLIDEGKAYYCFCTEERLEALHAEQRAHGEMTHYDGCCRDLPKEEVEQRLAAGAPYIIRQKIPREGVTGFDDMVYGHIEVNNSEMDDQILIKTDGMPTYNFANVVDDHLMGITHVIRGSEYLSSTPKYNLLYQAFGWDIPTYNHCPPVMKDAQNKLSKRNGDASFQDLVAKGYLPAAILNYIALLGWNPGTEQEIFSLAELEQVFDAERLNKSPAIFDIAKLRWMNGCYIRALPFAEFHALACKEYDKFITRSINREELSKVLQPRVETLNDIAETAGFIETLPAYGEELFNNKKMKTDPEIAKKSLQLALPALESLSADGWNNESLFECLKAVAAANGLKNGQVLYPVRIALTGLETTPGGASEIAAVLGREETLRRIKLAL